MKNFWQDIAFTLVFAVAMIVALEVAIARTPNEYSYKDWYMTENADKIKILILGNSLFANSFDPHVFEDSVFDGAITGRRFFYDVEIVRKYAPRMNNLEAVLIPLHICLFVEPQTELFYRYRNARFLGIPYGSNPLQYSALFSDYLSYNHIFPQPIFKKMEKNNRNSSGIDSLGYSPLFNVWDGKSQHNESLKTFEEFMASKEVFIGQLKKMAEICDSIGVRLICILPPLTNLYIGKIAPGQFDTLNYTMQHLSNTLKIEYRFYHNDSAFRADSLYFDELHLNYIGASLFAQRVKNDFNL